MTEKSKRSFILSPYNRKAIRMGKSNGNHLRCSPYTRLRSLLSWLDAKTKTRSRSGQSAAQAMVIFSRSAGILSVIRLSKLDSLKSLSNSKGYSR